MSWKKTLCKDDGLSFEIHRLKLGKRFILSVTENKYWNRSGQVENDGWYCELCIYETDKGKVYLSDPIFETRHYKSAEKAKEVGVLRAAQVFGPALYVLEKAAK